MSSKKNGSGLISLARRMRIHRDVTPRSIESFLSSLDCPRALTCWLLFKSNEHDQLANLKFNPLGYNDLETTRRSYLATKFLSKYDSLNLTVDKEAAAIEKFLLYEEKCRVTNSRFRNLCSSTGFTGTTVYLHNAIRRKIHKILGEFPIEEMIQSCGWGPGATTLMKRRDASASNKFQLEAGITRDLYSLIPFNLLEVAYPLWAREIRSGLGDSTRPAFPRFVVGNKIVTVPKDSAINRVIAIEPGINLWFQKGIGDCIGRRLLRVGVNLQNQSINGSLARVGSIDSSLSTVDLSSASDSVSLELVRELLPPDWFSIMDSARSHYGQLGDKLIKWEKFSSMGNGFTFQLESLLFFAIASIAVEYTNSIGRVSVYGDDVVLPTSAYPLFSDLLTFYGFSVNYSKSYSISWFRESCGYHWYRGFDIKPVYLKSKLSSVLSVYRLANAVRLLSHRSCNYMACDSSFKPTFDYLMSVVPSVLRLKIPFTLGDGGFISNFDEATPVIRRKQHIWLEGYVVPNFTTRSNSIRDERAGYLLNRLWSMPRNLPAREFQEGPTIFPDSSTGKKFEGYNCSPTHSLKLTLSRTIVLQWYDLGPWV